MLLGTLPVGRYIVIFKMWLRVIGRTRNDSAYQVNNSNNEERQEVLSVCVTLFS